MDPLRFQIRGNQESDRGNPMGYVRSTQAGQFKPNVARYNDWKQYVIKQLLRSRAQEIILKQPGAAKPYSGKIFESSYSLKFYVHIMIWWSSDLHADPDNVKKGINDALFTNDKYLAGSFDYADSPDGKGRVEVFIGTGDAARERPIFESVAENKT